MKSILVLALFEICQLLFHVFEILVGLMSRELVKGNAVKRGCQEYIRLPPSCTLSRRILQLLALGISKLCLNFHPRDMLNWYNSGSYSSRKRREQEIGTLSSNLVQRLIPPPTFQASSRADG